MKKKYLNQIIKDYKTSMNKKVYFAGFNKDECIEHILSCYTALYDLDSVIYYCDDYLESGDVNFNVYYFKAQALSYKGLYDEALEYYDLALLHFLQTLGSYCDNNFCNILIFHFY